MSRLKNNQLKPIIYGMGGGVLMGIVMGILLDDPGTGMAFGLAMGGGFWCALNNENE